MYQQQKSWKNIITKEAFWLWIRLESVHTYSASILDVCCVVQIVDQDNLIKFTDGWIQSMFQTFCSILIFYQMKRIVIEVTEKELFSTDLRRTFGCKRNRATLWIIRGAVYLKKYVISLVGGLQTSENSNHLIIKKATLELTHEFLRVCTGWWKWKLNTLEILNGKAYRKNEFLSLQNPVYTSDDYTSKMQR